MNVSKKRLKSIVDKLEKGIGFVMQPKTAIMVNYNMSSADVFTSPLYPDERYNKIDKEMGSEFVLALTALHDLKELLNSSCTKEAT